MPMCDHQSQGRATSCQLGEAGEDDQHDAKIDKSICEECCHVQTHGGQSQESRWCRASSPTHWLLIKEITSTRGDTSSSGQGTDRHCHDQLGEASHAFEGSYSDILGQQGSGCQAENVLVQKRPLHQLASHREEQREAIPGTNTSTKKLHCFTK